MSIVSMKHLRLIALSNDRDALIHDLEKLGVLEISAPTPDDWSIELSPCVSDYSRLRGELTELTNASTALAKHSKIKRGMFAERKKVSPEYFFSDEIITTALLKAREINTLEHELSAAYSEEGRLKNKRESLTPWAELDAPLETTATSMHYATFGVAPAVHSFDELRAAVCAAVPDCLVVCGASDREQHYLFLLCHKDDRDALLSALKPFAFSRTQFKGLTGTSRDNIAEINDNLKELALRKDAITEKLKAFADASPALDAATDALTTRASRAAVTERMRKTERTVLLSGWFPERETARLQKLFDSYGAAYEIRDPNDDEEPPILTYNSKLIAPFGLITNMYSPPAYRGIDPNPLMAPFFAVFFGIMLADAAYGLILTIVGAVVLLKFKPRGFMKQIMSLSVICGISTFFWGAMFGGFFGDAISGVYTLITGKAFTVNLALWFNPLEDPMKMLMFSFILGGIHIFFGMAIKAYLMIRDGHLLDAIFDIGSWWVLFGGVVFALLGMMQLGLILMGVGALALLLTQGRHEKNFFKKITKGLSSLYDITAYLGDILSY
ncbi:MAG: V-type ATPase 116kDa subunit family protein, partial [Clostridia bacterium]